jgi:hypothetical protein
VSKSGDKYRSRPEVKEIYRLRTREFAARGRAFINSVKSGVPCIDCGIVFPPECMDFDHVRGVKLFDVGDSVHRSISNITEEIEKCELVCANCHRIRTKVRRQITMTGEV